MEILIGADPEVFVRNRLGFMSGHDLIPGTKENPYVVDGGAVQVDGTALEFNIDPAKTRVEFVGSVVHVFNQLEQMAQAKDPSIRLIATPVADFDPQVFMAIPDEAKKLGCNPDFNAWTGDANPTPVGDRPFRTGSGHVHVGWCSGADCGDIGHLELCQRVVRQLDYYLGIYSLLWDKDNRRRELYGKAGAYRPKAYGLEYRVLSNRWLASPELTGWVYDTTRRALSDLMDGKYLPDQYGDLAQKIIDTNQTDWFDTYGDICEIEAPPVIELD